MRFDGDWEVASALPEKAMLVSLQGLANRDEAQLYIIHPADFQWEITEPLYDFYKRKHGIKFKEIETAKAAETAAPQSARAAAGCPHTTRAAARSPRPSSRASIAGSSRSCSDRKQNAGLGSTAHKFKENFAPF